MAQAKTIRFSQFVLLVGDAGSPEQFAAPCGLTSRGFNRTAETNDTNVPDCEDEDAPSWLERDIVSQSAEISGSGVLDADAKETWEGWFSDGTSRNVRVSLTTTTNGGHWAGQFKLTQLNISGERGSRVLVEVTLQSDGPVTWVPASP